MPGCHAILREGDSFEVTYAASRLRLPDDRTVARVTFEVPTFDQTDPAGMNDAFEMAVVDARRQSIGPHVRAGA